MKAKNTITQNQFILMTIQSQIGVGVLSLPYKTFGAAKSDAWISVLLTGVLVQISILIIWALCRRFPSYTLFEFLNFLLGKVLGSILTVVYIIYFISVCMILLYYYSHVMKTWILPLTPIWFTTLLMVFTSYYLGKESLQIIARFFGVVFILLVIVLLLISYGLKHANIFYILPIGQSEWGAIFKGSKESLLAFSGFEAFLIMYPFIEGTGRGKLKSMFIANLIVTMFYTYIVIVTLLFFSPEEMSRMPEPLLYLVKIFSSQIITRTDLIFLSIWIISIMTSIVICMYVASNGLATLLKKKNHNQVLPIITVIIYLFALFSTDIEILNILENYVSNAAIVLTLLIPFCLLCLTYIKNKCEVR